MKHNRQRKPGKLQILLLICLSFVFCLSAYKVGSQLLTERKEKQAFEELVAQVSVARPTLRPRATATPAPAETSAAPEAAQTAAPTEAASAPAVDEVSAAPEPGILTASVQPLSSPAPADISAQTATDNPQGSDAPQASPTPEPTPEPTPDPTPKPSPTEVPPMLEAYEPLYKQNKHLFGWLTIEGTEVNFPVMHTPWNSEYYLHRTFNRIDSFSGVPFMDGTCYPGCGNYLIYGHHMKNGTMFAPIVQYASKEFWREHPLIYFDTLYEYGTYEVVAAFYSRVYTAEDTGAFLYYRYTDLSEPETFDEYMAQVLSAAIYDTGVEAVYGDQLITLSTCEYSVENGRFVVVAVKID